MKVLWTTLKLLSGVVLIVALCVTAMALVLPGLTTHLGQVLVSAGLAAGLYGLSHRQLAAWPSQPVRASLGWRGDRLLVPARGLAQVVLCAVLCAVVLGLLVAMAKESSGSVGTKWALGLGLLISLWVAMGAWAGYVRRLRAGYALLLDTSGACYPGTPPVPWSAVRGLAIHPEVEDSDSTQSLVLELMPAYARPNGAARWLLPSLPGAQFGRDTVAFPLYLMQAKPLQVLAAAQHLWRRAHPSMPR